MTSASQAPATSEFKTDQDKQHYDELSKNFQKSVKDMNNLTQSSDKNYIQMVNNNYNAAPATPYPTNATAAYMQQQQTHSVSQVAQAQQYQDQMQKSYAAFISQYPASTSQYMQYMDPMIMSYGQGGQGGYGGGVGGWMGGTMAGAMAGAIQITGTTGGNIQQLGQEQTPSDRNQMGNE